MLNDAASGRALVLGGIRSGKSAFAEELAGRAGVVRYIATAAVDPKDADFTERVAAHRVRRPGQWTVVEGDPVAALAEPVRMTLVDDLGTWLTGRIDARAAWEAPRGTVAEDIDALVSAVRDYPRGLVLVSPEVGLGVVPATRSGRLFADEIGELNQRLAAVCDEVYLVVAGVATRIKPGVEAGRGTGAETAAVLGGGAALGASVAGGVGVDPAVGSTPGGEKATAASTSGGSPRRAGATGADPTAAGGHAEGGAGVAGAGVSETGAAVSAAGGVEDATAGSGAGIPPVDGAEGVVGGAATGISAAGGAESAGVGADSTAANGASSWIARGGGSFDVPPVFATVRAPDALVRAEAEARQLRLTKPVGALGRLEVLGNWIAACQGACPPRQFERARVVVFAGDHGVARQGVSAYPSEVTAQMVANFRAGGAAVNVLARLAGASVRVVDIAVDGDTDPAVSDYKIRRSSGSIDREDALTDQQVNAALAAGRAIADEEIDGGADLLIAGDMGIGNTTPATVLIASLTDTEPVLAVGRGTGVDDAGWMRKTAAVRDAMWRARPHLKDPVALLRVAAGADLAAAAGYLAQAAARRTPVVLDGVVITAAALVAEMLAPGAKDWWIAGHRSTEPAHQMALTKLGLQPLLDLDMRLGEGSGALTALPILRAAVETLSAMATFDEAGVSTAEAPRAVAP
ncbi:nicotinate-nucleotide--dimethylbenzimidazole phosphoribosyltransferase [Nocardia sp. CDC159]|uniref:Nicotinate-nucleotide--dimethylbenzimidazole phosphoribosyltransferase n=1 Tax=Nocardia pulmonis TaxID=2951408 RepID=A0A9X2IV11_9NOCA|nr:MULTISPECIES: nicotinate-nucleotide--dimethylbenzimidazole phosphoribosyltransferase [Nocardia]MCM6773407.1 nicotinate-nucleotide--dimethylbenzimidazole phosphoribosyltransferase [Nocardia pulmonis]MCM6786294.1 nicotinate-nucleotide--dimethylbenzimidazole phosphoribosyltransferase [Nocardia sp. CDC159]